VIPVLIGNENEVLIPVQESVIEKLEFAVYPREWDRVKW
jgi:hypothetical protein